MICSYLRFFSGKVFIPERTWKIIAECVPALSLEKFRETETKLYDKTDIVSSRFCSIK